MAGQRAPKAVGEGVGPRMFITRDKADGLFLGVRPKGGKAHRKAGKGPKCPTANDLPCPLCPQDLSGCEILTLSFSLFDSQTPPLASWFLGPRVGA